MAIKVDDLYSIILSVNNSVLFPCDRNIVISYVRLRVLITCWKTIVREPVTSTSNTPICKCAADRQTVEHFLFHCIKYEIS